jgi:hypothetical protein
MIVIEYENVMVKELDAGPFNHDNTITITFKRDDCRSVGRSSDTAIGPIPQPLHAKALP